MDFLLSPLAMNCYMNLAQAEKMLGRAQMKLTYMMQDALFIIYQ